MRLGNVLKHLFSDEKWLAWTPPVLDDGSGTPSHYEIWRRAGRTNAAFVKIGTTTGLTYLDMSLSTPNVEYQITAVIPAP
jgi:hypothetical protein